MKSYILPDLNDSNKLKIERRSHKPSSAVCEAPVENGLYIEDVDVIVIKDVWLDGLIESEVDENTPQDAITYKKAFVDPTLKSNKDAQIAQDIIDKKWESMRAQRDKLLQETDYIMMPDYPMVDKSAYETYRQALRDLPSTIVDIDNFSYPVKP